MHLKMALSSLCMVLSFVAFCHDYVLACLVLWLLAVWLLSLDEDDPDGYT